ncbi:ABC transporter permease [Halomonas piscis]|uniref:ABC transporter permease n=1 Tax=Halomonas piscis TaxID=3031727 RepID=UPI00289D7A26|nr:ABC transporter permease [Halomonas piscis]
MALQSGTSLRSPVYRRLLNGLSTCRQHLPLILLLTRQELIDRHKGSLLGRLWTVVAPLVNILVFVLIFSTIMGAKLEGFGASVDQYTYSIYLISGILAWTAFAKSLSAITNTFLDRAGMITKINTSLKALPLSTLLAESVIYTMGMAFFMVFLWLVDFPVTAFWLGVPLIFLLQLAFTYALGLLLATLAVYLKDVREGVAVLLPVWFWLTPVVYVEEIIPPWALTMISINPMFQLIHAYRELILYQQVPALPGLLGVMLVTVMLFIAAFWLLGRTERDLRDAL